MKLAIRAHKEGRKTHAEIINFYASEPSFEELDIATQEEVALIAYQLATIEEAKAKVLAAKINYEREKDTFLADAQEKSKHTRIGYEAGLVRLEAYTSAHNLQIATLTPAQADDFIRYLKHDTQSASASIRLYVSAVSSFYTSLERRYDFVRNPFRGTKSRPVAKNSEPTIPQSKKEVKAIIAQLPPFEAAAVAIFAYRGLRAGALPTLTKKGKRYIGSSKGKELRENGSAGITIPRACIDAIKKAGLDEVQPFADLKANTLEHRIARAIAKLHKTGKCKASYSCHDFRHFFAVDFYTATKDIYALKDKLNHANIAITETYLRSMNIEL